MSSRRVFRQVNYIHHALAEVGQAMKPFGGKQLIVVGERISASTSAWPLRRWKAHLQRR